MVKGRSSGDGGVQMKGREEGGKESNGSEHSRIKSNIDPVAPPVEVLTAFTSCRKV